MVAETEGGSEQDDVSFLRTVSIYHILIKNYSFKNVIGRHGLSLLYSHRRTSLLGG